MEVCLFFKQAEIRASIYSFANQRSLGLASLEGLEGSSVSQKGGLLDKTPWAHSESSSRGDRILLC